MRSGLHPGLELRLAHLGERIAEAKQKAERAQGLAKIDAGIRRAALERRYLDWEERLQRLDRDSPSALAPLKAGLAQIAFDVTTSLDACDEWLESAYRAGRT